MDAATTSSARPDASWEPVEELWPVAGSDRCVVRLSGEVSTTGTRQLPAGPLNPPTPPTRCRGSPKGRMALPWRWGQWQRCRLAPARLRWLLHPSHPWCAACTTTMPRLRTRVPARRCDPACKSGAAHGGMCVCEGGGSPLVHDFGGGATGLTRSSGERQPRGLPGTGTLPGAERVPPGGSRVFLGEGLHGSHHRRAPCHFR